MPREYVLEVYEAGSARDVRVSFTSDAPFMAILPGELLNPGWWPGEANPPDHVLRVLNVQHIIGEPAGVLKHTIMVFTDKVENTRENTRRWAAP